MAVERRLGRRLFLHEICRATYGMVVMTSLGACATSGGGATGSETPSAPPPTRASEAVEWHRVNLGFVSAYILVRGSEAAVVDTGVEGSADDIEQALTTAGLDWGAVGHVILTHKHPDHVGSAIAVLERATGAIPYAGHEDIAAIAAPRDVTAVADDDEVFGLRVITTPGHTPGHICVLDPAGGVLVAGDALNGAQGGVAGPNAQYTEDMDTANMSVRKLAGYTYETVLFGHGEPVEAGADAEVAELAATL